MFGYKMALSRTVFRSDIINVRIGCCRRWNVSKAVRLMHHLPPLPIKRRHPPPTMIRPTMPASIICAHNNNDSTIHMRSRWSRRNFHSIPISISPTNVSLSMNISPNFTHAMSRHFLSTTPCNANGIESINDNNRLSHEEKDNQSKPKIGNDDDVNSEESLLEYYESLIHSGEVTSDPHQIRALKELDRLRGECIPYMKKEEDNANNTTTNDGNHESWSMTSLFSLTPSWANPSIGDDVRNQQQSSSTISSPPKGIYIHGGVGCGKTYCMNLFYESLPSTMGKQKVHFHKFMLNIHKQMHKAKTIKKLQGDDVIDYVIQSTLKRGKILCFDEFQVTDIADAMILKRLFTGLIDNGTVIIATSNRPPRDLYKGGLQRELFIPFIDLLEETCTVVSMWESDMDYRLVQGGDETHKGAQKVYFVDRDEESKGAAKESFSSLFRKLTKDAYINSMVLDVQGREVFVPKAAEEYSIARFSFYDLCGTAKGAADYLAIGETFNTVFIEDVPKLKYHEVNLVRRWITLIDSLYECHVKLVIHAETNPEDMFQIDLEDENCDEVFAFDRTRSRMEEMRSESYLKKKWVGSQL